MRKPLCEGSAARSVPTWFARTWLPFPWPCLAGSQASLNCSVNRSLHPHTLKLEGAGEAGAQCRSSLVIGKPNTPAKPLPESRLVPDSANYTRATRLLRPQGRKTPVGCQAKGCHFLCCLLWAQLLGLVCDLVARRSTQFNHLTSQRHTFNLERSTRGENMFNHRPDTVSWACHLTYLDRTYLADVGRSVIRCI